MYKIVIIMFLLNPNANDALEVEFKDGKVLEFKTLEDCYNHVNTNLKELKLFAYSEFGPNTPIKSINCFQKFIGVNTNG